MRHRCWTSEISDTKHTKILAISSLRVKTRGYKQQSQLREKSLGVLRLRSRGNRSEFIKWTPGSRKSFRKDSFLLLGGTECGRNQHKNVGLVPHGLLSARSIQSRDSSPSSAAQTISSLAAGRRGHRFSTNAPAAGAPTQRACLTGGRGCVLCTHRAPRKQQEYLDQYCYTAPGTACPILGNRPQH